MFDWIINLNLPKFIVTFLIAFLPIFELRGAIPVGLGVFKLSIPTAFFWSWLGSIVPSFFLIYGLGVFSEFLSRHSSRAEHFFKWWFERTHKRFWRHHQKLGSLALVFFVAIPLPITGVWTGSVAAFLFGIRRMKAFLLISLGSLIAGVIVTLIYLGVLSFFSFLI